MRPLLDGDVLRYEIGWCGEYDELDENTNETVHHIREWDFVQGLLDDRIAGICKDVDADEPPTIFLTGNSHSTRILNRIRETPIELLPSLREQLATIKPYKGTRKPVKPFHFNNITAYMLDNYNINIANDGLEADDHMAMSQNENTIICTRDKDLRMVEGWHFGWECGKQVSFGPELVDKKGWLKEINGDIKGVGLKFFFYQMLVGDTVDNIAGCPKVGPKKAFKLLSECTTKKEHEDAVRASYEAVYGDEYMKYLEENSRLLWMIRELDKEGNPIGYNWN